MSTATLTRWGNSQGIVIPKAYCEQLGIRVGDAVDVVVEDGSLRIVPSRRHRRHRIGIDDLFKGWEGRYVPPADYPARDAEIDWGEPRGGEA